MGSPRPRAVVLVSGGVDSATTLAILRGQGFDCYALSVDYGQRHRAELDAAARIHWGPSITVWCGWISQPSADRP